MLYVQVTITSYDSGVLGVMGLVTCCMASCLGVAVCCFVVGSLVDPWKLLPLMWRLLQLMYSAISSGGCLLAYHKKEGMLETDQTLAAKVLRTAVCLMQSLAVMSNLPMTISS
jgi:hypothetical protein